MAWKKITVAAGAIVAVSAALGVIGYKADRPVWLSEHTALAGEVKDNTEFRYEMSVNQIQERIWKIEDRMEKVGREPELVDRHRRLKATLIKAEKRLDKVRGR